MTKRTDHLISILWIVAIFAPLGAFFYYQLVYPFQTHGAAIKQLTELEESLKPGEPLTDTEVEMIVHDRHLSLLRVRPATPTLIIVSTPLQVGAQNWLLVIALDEQVVSGIGYRLADSIKIKPRDAPPDRVRDPNTKQWQAEFGPLDER